MKSLNRKEVVAKVGLSQQTIWRYEKLGLFPRRIKTGLRRIGWLEHEVDEWLRSREKVAA